ncbi:unnamed protein product [Urochloa humidicola]
MTLPPGNARLLGSCVPTTDDDAADLRAALEKLMAAAAEKLLVAASGQVLGATVALLLPVRPVAFFACVLGGFTSLPRQRSAVDDARLLPRLWSTACSPSTTGSSSSSCGWCSSSAAASPSFEITRKLPCLQPLRQESVTVGSI